MAPDFSGLKLLLQILVVGFCLGVGFGLQAVAGIWIDSAWLWAFPGVALVGGLLVAAQLD